MMDSARIPPPVIYVSGPLTAKTPEERAFNINNAIAVGLKLHQAGAVPFVPHLNSEVPGLGWEDFIAWDIAMIPRVDALVRLPGSSKGAAVEEAVARQFEKPVIILDSGWRKETDIWWEQIVARIEYTLSRRRDDE